MTTDYDSFASDLPDTGSVTFSCLEEHEELLSSDGVSASMKQLSKGAYNSRFASRCWGEVELLSSRVSAAMAIDLEPPADRVYNWLKPLSGLTMEPLCTRRDREAPNNR